MGYAGDEGRLRSTIRFQWLKQHLTINPPMTLLRRCKLIDWSYMDFSRTLRVDNTYLGTIKEVIKKWHGGKIASLTVCKDSYQEINELTEDNLTLKECGIHGSEDKNQAPVVILYYDFKPDGCTEPDPILMC
jgi:hypothetical protein